MIVTFLVRMPVAPGVEKGREREEENANAKEASNRAPDAPRTIDGK